MFHISDKKERQIQPLKQFAELSPCPPQSIEPSDEFQTVQRYLGSC